MKILLTGASSFVTKSLIIKLLNDDHDIIAISRSKGYQKKKIKIHKHNLNIQKLNYSIWEDVKCVIHLANVNNNSDNDPAKNLKILKNLIEGMPNTVEKFIFISSQMIYGNPNKTNINENHDIDPFYSNYSLGKFLCEKYLIQNKHIIKNNLIILRISGFVDSKKSLMFKMIDKIKNQKNIVLYNHGKTYRDYLFLDDLHNVIKKILNKDINLKQKTYIFNLSSIQNCSLLTLAEKIKKKFQSKSKIILSNRNEIRSSFSFNINLIKKN